MRETWVQSLGQEDTLEKEMATHSITLARKIPWTEEPGGCSLWGHKETRLSDFTSALQADFLPTELQGKPHIEGYLRANLPLFGEEFFDPELEKLYKCGFGASRTLQVQNAGTRTVSPFTLLGGEALVEVVMGVVSGWESIAIWLRK